MTVHRVDNALLADLSKRAGWGRLGRRTSHRGHRGSSRESNDIPVECNRLALIAKMVSGQSIFFVEVTIVEAFGFDSRLIFMVDVVNIWKRQGRENYCSKIGR